ncbi:MAG: hypothetical protein ACU88J_00930 [Gammaproteobacteria bacterium]
MNQNVVNRIQSPGPKKILACDGGGILGLMSVEIFLKIDEELHKKLGKGPDFVLADYFDFICDTDLFSAGNDNSWQGYCQSLRFCICRWRRDHL